MITLSVVQKDIAFSLYVHVYCSSSFTLLVTITYGYVTLQKSNIDTTICRFFLKGVTFPNHHFGYPFFNFHGCSSRAGFQRFLPCISRPFPLPCWLYLRSLEPKVTFFVKLGNCFDMTESSGHNLLT